MTNQTIDGVSRKSLEQALKLAVVFDDGGDGADAESARGVVWILRALLDAPSCSTCNDTGRMHEPGCEPGACTACFEKPAAQPQGEPVAFTAVGVLRDDGDGGLVPEWILEGGTAELWAGAVLLIADEDQDLCAEDGHCELYRASPEQPAPVAVVLPDREMYCQYLRGVIPDNRLEVEAHKDGWNACLDELKRLNPSL
ncbi:MAG: hypothetical protein WBI95_09825 [Pseudomonas veronii]|uniref:hypothetical protein n=1 Tax=Pseudomonas veronii TaxID=76761 RepID=UPI003C71A6E1